MTYQLTRRVVLGIYAVLVIVPLVVVIFENEDDYAKGDEIMDSMPAGDTPGQRSSVTKYNVATRMKS